MGKIQEKIEIEKGTKGERGQQRKITRERERKGHSEEGNLDGKRE